jgi:hypothetical protein
MADFLDGLKKRFGRKKAKEAEPDVAKATLERLIDLKAWIATDKKGDTPQEFFRIVKDYFQKSLKIKYQFTYEELIVEIARHNLGDELKKTLIDFVEHIIKMEFSDRRYDKKYLLQQTERFEDIVIKTSEEISKQAKKAKVPKEKQKQAKEEILPAPVKLGFLEPRSQSKISQAAETESQPDVAQPKPTFFGSLAGKFAKQPEPAESDASPAQKPAPSVIQPVVNPAKSSKPAQPAKPAEQSKQPSKPAQAVKPVKPFAPIKHEEFLKTDSSPKSAPSGKGKPLPASIIPDTPSPALSRAPSPAASPASRATAASAKSAGKPAVPPLAAKAMDDKISQIYTLFNSGYELINKKKPVDAREVLLRIRKLNEKLDKDAKIQFKDEIAHLEEEITFLQNAQKEQAKKAKAKAQSEQALEASRKSSKKSRQPELPEPELDGHAAKPGPFSFLSRLIPKPGGQKPQETIDEMPKAPLATPASLSSAEPPPEVNKHPILKKKAAKAKDKAAAKTAPAVLEPPEMPDASETSIGKSDRSGLQPRQDESLPEPPVAEKKKGLFANLFRKQEKPIKDDLAEKLDSPGTMPVDAVSVAPAPIEPSGFEPSESGLTTLSSASPIFGMASRADGEEMPKLPKLSGYDADEAEQRRISAIVEQMYKDAKEKKAGDEPVWQKSHSFNQLINRPLFGKKAKGPEQPKPLSGNIAQNQTEESESDLLPPPISSPISSLSSSSFSSSSSSSTSLYPVQPEEEASFPLPGQSKQSNDQEGLQKISALVGQMHVSLAHKDLSDANLCWARIIGIRQYLSPGLQKKLSRYTEGIEQELENLKSRQADAIVYPPLPQAEDGSYTTEAGGIAVDHNQMISDIIRSKGFASEPKQAASKGKDPSARPTSAFPPKISSLRSSSPKSAVKAKEAAPKAQKPLPAAQPEQKPEDTLNAITSMIDSARELIRSERIDEATQAYKQAILLRKKLVASDDIKNKLNYDLMGINVELRMAKIK